MSWADVAPKEVRFVAAGARTSTQVLRRGLMWHPSAMNTPDKGCDLLRALGSASSDIAHETGGTI